MTTDVYTRITDRIIAVLEQGERPWLKPWNAEHAAGKISRPLRHNGLPYSGINVLVLWVEAEGKGYSAPLWMTFKQAQELGGNVRKGEQGSSVVYANTLTKTEHNDETDEDEERTRQPGVCLFSPIRANPARVFQYGTECEPASPWKGHRTVH